MIQEPPLGSNLEDVKRWARDQLKHLDNDTRTYIQFAPLGAVPAGLQLVPGLLAYYQAGALGAGSPEGLHQYKSTGWVAL
jgi:hypothetical protein